MKDTKTLNNGKKEEIINQFPMIVNDFKLLELLSQVSGYTQEDISEIWDFSNKKKMNLDIQQFDSILINIDTYMNRKILKSINILSQYKSKSKEEIMQILDININDLKNQMIQDGETLLNELDIIYQGIIKLERDMGRFYFDNKYYGIKFECIKVYLTDEEFKEYVEYYNKNRTEILQEERKSEYPENTEPFLERYGTITKTFNDKILSIIKKHNDCGNRIFDWNMDHKIDFDIGQLSFGNEIKEIGHLRGTIGGFLERYELVRGELKKFIIR